MVLNQNNQSSGDQNNIQLADLQNLLMIVDIASQRGAFKGPELSQVGMVFDKVAKFLQSVAPPQDQAAQTPQVQAPQPTFVNPDAPVSTSSTPPFFTGGSN